MIESRFIEKLLNGREVEWKPLDKIVETITAPSKVKREIYQEKGRIPIIDQGEKFISGYTDIDFGTLKSDEYIIFGDHSEHIKYVNFSFIQGADGLKILKPKNNGNAKYIYYAFQNFYNKELNYKRHWNTAKETLIPLPPSDVQQEIVRILDAFTSLTAELTAELTSRQKQYQYFRDKLLNFDDISDRGGYETNPITKALWHNKKVVFKTLGEVVKIKNGKDWKQLEKGSIPVYGSGGIMASVDAFSYDKPTVLIPRKGSITNIFYVETPFWNVDTIYYTEININELIPKYFYHYMKTIDLEKLDTGSGRPSLTQEILYKIKIPVPSLEEQQRIVAILDKFETLTNSIAEGLPKEIELRRKQYEYYREQLLTFPK